MNQEGKRKVIHIGMSSFALLLRPLNWWQASICALIALTYNLLVLPKVSRDIYREDDQARGYALGVVLYPITVLILIVLFRNHLFIAAGCWGILAFGDGLASIFGRKWGRAKWPWNANRSYIGSLAYAFFGGLGAMFFIWWVNEPQGTWTLGFGQIAAYAFLTSIFCAFVETLPLPVDDNLSAPLAGGVFLYLLSGVI